MPPSESSVMNVDHAVECLRRGGVVSFPTDTLFALGADALSPQALRRVIEIKGRRPAMGLPLLIADSADLDTIAIDIPEVARELALRFWPGPLTLVVKKAPHIPALVTGNRDSVAVRVPNHPLAIVLIDRLGGPVTGTSANLTGGPDPLSAKQVCEFLGTACDLVLDGPPPPDGIRSTIVDVSGRWPRLIRAGAVPWESVEMTVTTSPV